MNRGLKPGVDPCRHCGGLHYGSGLACPFLCGACFKDTRPDAEDRCKCLEGMPDGSASKIASGHSSGAENQFAENARDDSSV